MLREMWKEKKFSIEKLKVLIHTLLNDHNNQTYFEKVLRFLYH